jgi:hypothetical protein
LIGGILLQSGGLIAGLLAHVGLKVIVRLLALLDKHRFTLRVTGKLPLLILRKGGLVFSTRFFLGLTPLLCAQSAKVSRYTADKSANASAYSCARTRDH